MRNLLIPIAFVALSYLFVDIFPALIGVSSEAYSQGIKNSAPNNQIDRKKRINELTQILIEEDFDDCQNELGELKRYPMRKVIPNWISILEKSESFELKKVIIDYLAPSRDGRLIIPFAKQLTSSFHAVRKSAAVALQKNASDRIYPYILNMSSSSNPVYKIYFIEAMNFVYDRRFYYMLTGMLKDPNKSIRIYVLNCIKINQITEAMNMVRNIALYDSNDEVKIAAIDLIGQLKDRGSQHVLFRTLNFNNRAVRLMTVKSLNKIAMTNSATHLSNRLVKESDHSIKDLIIDTLIKIRKSGNISGLKRILLHDDNVDLKIKAAYALGYIRDKRGISVLIDSSGDESYKVRAEVAHSLGSFQNRAVTQKLLFIIKNDKKRYVRTAAIYSIEKINDRKSTLKLFDVFSNEKDIIVKELLRKLVRKNIRRHI